MLGHAKKVLEFTFRLPLGLGETFALSDKGLDTGFGDYI